MARSSSRSRARSAPRHATTRTTAARGGGGGLAKYILPAAAVGVVAYLLWPKTAKAATSTGPTPPTPPDVRPPPPPPPPPPPQPFPPGATLGKIAVAGFPGMNVRSRPSPSGALVTSLPNGTVFQMTDPLSVQGYADYIPEEGLTPSPNNRWAAIRTANGVTGYLRAIGPAGEMNIQLVRAGDIASQMPMGEAPPPPAGGYPGARSAGSSSTGALMPFLPFHPHYPHHLRHPQRLPAPPGWRGW